MIQGLSCANRCYYACFQAAIAALLAEGIRARGQWSHEFVQGQFVGVLINQRHLYETQLRRVLADNQTVREKADYRPELVNATQASRALRRTRGSRSKRSRTCWLRINTPGSPDRFFKGLKGLIERTLLASQRHSEPW